MRDRSGGATAGLSISFAIDMQDSTTIPSGSRYADCIAKSQRIRWDIETDVIRGRSFNLLNSFLPRDLSLVDRLDFLSIEDRRWLSQVQGRTYANMFGMVERFIGAKMLDLSRAHWLGDQVALEAMVRFTDEELKHQALFRRIDSMLGAVMPPGYEFKPDPDQIAQAVLGSHDWAVLALTCHIELFTQDHYRQSLQGGTGLCEIFRDVFRFHWMEESQHAIIDELEWRRVHAEITPKELDMAVDDLIQLIYAVDAIVEVQAAADCKYFQRHSQARLTSLQAGSLSACFHQAYRWQYLVSGFQNAKYSKLLGELLGAEHLKRISAATQSIVAAVTPE